MSKRQPLEAKLEDKSVKYAEGLGWEHIKLDLAKRSWPDRLFLGPGAAVLFVEFKREGEMLRPHQVNRCAKLRAMGFEVFVIDNFGDFVAIMEDRTTNKG